MKGDTRVIARCVLLEIALREAIDYSLERGASTDEAIHASRQLRREIRQVAA
jgi:hypothetical protein